MLETLITILIVILALVGTLFIIAAIAVALDKKKEKNKHFYDFIESPVFLKNCPCCGGTAKVEEIRDYYFIKCTSCNLTSGVEKIKIDAANSWNRRMEVTNE